MRAHSLILDGFWARPHRWEPLRAALAIRAGPAEIFYYNSSGVRRLESLAAELIDRIRNIGEPVNLIGYSMGGLVVRTACLLAPDLPAACGLPEHTSRWHHSRMAPAIARRSPDAPKQRIAPQAEGATWNIPTLVVSNPLDTAIVPPCNTQWEISTGSNAVCSVPIHVWPIFSTALREQIVQFIGGEQANCP